MNEIKEFKLANLATITIMIRKAHRVKNYFNKLNQMIEKQKNRVDKPQPTMRMLRAQNETANNEAALAKEEVKAWKKKHASLIRIFKKEAQKASAFLFKTHALTCAVCVLIYAKRV